ncbi:hypothetical protein KDA_31190 [Dictyobacter alpinus]|uniref:Uncharacterized protein n=1 Tax=Dictyobacter alpinus TaxID=2014873 RepID=A0A402B8F6_9CHLR|nr:hypothetical protein KDA_31190 [Dictyobacter alpinus]
MELGIAYCQRTLQHSRKLLLGSQTDSRAAFLGSKLNPMIRVPLDGIAPRGQGSAAYGEGIHSALHVCVSV